MFIGMKAPDGKAPAYLPTVIRLRREEVKKAVSRTVAQGTPEDFAKSKESHTGRFLKEVLARRPVKKGKLTKEAAE